MKQIGFAEVAPNFVETLSNGWRLTATVDGEEFEDIGLINDIMRRRFACELQN